MFTTIHYNFLLQKRAFRFHANEIEDAADEKYTRRMTLIIATAYARERPLAFSLDRNNYTDAEAFDTLVRSIRIPDGSD